MQSEQLKIDTPEQIALELSLAGIGSRFLALVIDTLLQAVVFLVIILVFVFSMPLGLRTYFRWIPVSFAPAVAILFLFCLYWGYFAFFEILLKGQTPGKMVAGIRVIHISGRPINVYEGITRNLLRAIDSFAIYGVGVICMMVSSQNRRLGDYAAGTVVIHDKRGEELKPSWNTAAGTPSRGPLPSQIRPEELVLIETFLQRRFDLGIDVREKAALQIATRISEKAGLQRDPGETPEHFLEAVARQVRDTARFT